MSTCAAQVEMHLSKNGQGVTDETDKTPISSVLSVRFVFIFGSLQYGCGVRSKSVTALELHNQIGGQLCIM